MSLQLFKSASNYLAQLNLPTFNENEFKLKPTEKAKLIIILDISGSMSSNVERIIVKILPGFIEKLGYSKKDYFYLITFDTVSEIHHFTINQLYECNIRARGCTYFKDALRLLKETLCSSKNNRFQILTISDGDIYDMEPSLNAADALCIALKTKPCDISSKAVRFFTSSSQPDTRALASVLQCNTKDKSTLMDIQCDTKDEIIIDTFVNLFENGNDKNHSNIIEISSQKPIIQTNPWSPPQQSVFLQQGSSNTLWFSEVPNQSEETQLLINGEKYNFDIKFGEAMNSSNAHILLGDKVDLFIEKIKILQIIGSIQSKAEIYEIVNHFHKLQESFEFEDEKNNNGGDGDDGMNEKKEEMTFKLRDRINRMKTLILKRKKSIFSLINEVANDTRVRTLNSAQQAEYLRTMDTTKNAKSLARRALGAGTDFTTQVIKEVKEMHAHLHEIEMIDDSEHVVSFYSQDTTLGGIKAVCSLVDDDIIEEFEATDILQMINIVGIACESTIGEYPDPMTWRVNHLFLGCYLSVSDISVYHLQSKGKKELHAAGYEDLGITTVIPFFDDLRILDFLMKYAPSILEYSASIGMRRVIAEVPTTHSYVICAAVWKLIQLIGQSSSSSSSSSSPRRTTLMIKSLRRLLDCLEHSFRSYFDHVLPFLTAPPNGKFMYSIANNGITNIILPIYKLYKKALSSSSSSSSSDNGSNCDELTKYVSNALRSAFSFEAAQIIRRILKKRAADKKEAYARDQFISLLSLDLENQKLTPLFEDDTPITLQSVTYKVNTALLNEYVAYFDDIKSVCLFPSLFSAFISSSNQSNSDNQNNINNDDNNDESILKQIPIVDDEFFLSSLSLSNYNDVIGGSDGGSDGGSGINSFYLNTLVQSLLYFNSKDRYDPTTKQMKIKDLVFRKLAEKKLIRQFVFNFYFQDFQAKAMKKAKEEEHVALKKLADFMLSSESIDLFESYLQFGIFYDQSSKSFHLCSPSSSSSSSEEEEKGNNKKEKRVYQFRNFNCFGVEYLKNELLNTSLAIPLRIQKIELFIVANRRIDDTPTWNKGNALKCDLEVLKSVFQFHDQINEWPEFEEFYHKHAIHQYRGGEELKNRHGHSNDKPSYWAIGFESMDAMKLAVSDQEWNNYLQIHCDCCGNKKI